MYPVQVHTGEFWLLVSDRFEMMRKMSLLILSAIPEFTSGYLGKLLTFNVSTLRPNVTVHIYRTPDLYSGGPGFKSWHEDLLSWLKLFSFPQSVQENAEITIKLFPWVTEHHAKKMEERRYCLLLCTANFPKILHTVSRWKVDILFPEIVGNCHHKW
jgi:hypothetical protein